MKDIKKIDRSEGKGKPNCFEMETTIEGSRTYYMFAEDPGDMEDWIKKICSAAGVKVPPPQTSSQSQSQSQPISSGSTRKPSPSSSTSPPGSFRKPSPQTKNLSQSPTPSKSIVQQNINSYSNLDATAVNSNSKPISSSTTSNPIANLKSTANITRSSSLNKPTPTPTSGVVRSSTQKAPSKPNQNVNSNVNPTVNTTNSNSTQYGGVTLKKTPTLSTSPPTNNQQNASQNKPFNQSFNTKPEKPLKQTTTSTTTASNSIKTGTNTPYPINTPFQVNLKRQSLKDDPIPPNAPKYVALYPYTPQRDDEMALNPGDIVTLLQEDGEWYCYFIIFINLVLIL